MLYCYFELCTAHGLTGAVNGCIVTCGYPKRLINNKQIGWATQDNSTVIAGIDSLKLSFPYFQSWISIP